MALPSSVRHHYPNYNNYNGPRMTNTVGCLGTNRKMEGHVLMWHGCATRPITCVPIPHHTLSLHTPTKCSSHNAMPFTSSGTPDGLVVAVGLGLRVGDGLLVMVGLGLGVAVGDPVCRL